MMRTKLLTGLVLAGILATGGVAAARSHHQVSGTPTPPPTDVCDFQGEQTDASTNPACDKDEQTPDSAGDTETGDHSDPDMNNSDSNAMSGDQSNMGHNGADASDQNENDQSGEQD